MARQLVYFLLIAICLNCGSSKILKKSPVRSTSNADLHLLTGTAYDYDYFAPEARRAPNHYQKASPTTTERPFIRYWNNFVRNIRLPVPSISWNMTNPLVNLFNAGATNVIDSPVGNYNHRSKKRKRSKNTRKQTKKRKHTPTTYEEEENGTYQTAYYDGYGEPFTVNFDPRKTVYFYDASTGQYYKIRKTLTQYSNIYAPPEQQQQQQLDEVAEDEVEEQEGQAAPITPQIEPPTMYTGNEITESNDEPLQQVNEELVVPDSQEVEESAEVEIIPPEVENIDESEEQTLLRQPFDDNQLSKQQNAKNVEKLRNSIGAYMSDDRFNRMRQRTSIKQKPKTVRSRDKSQPRKKFIYYVLQRV